MRILIIQHEDGTGPSYVGERLAALGATLDVRHPWLDSDSDSDGDGDGHGDGHASALPADLTAHDALIVLGGSQAAYDPIPWWPQVHALLAEAVATDVPTLAICLGAQLLASASGGEVRRAAKPEVGLCTLTPYPNPDPLFDALPSGARAVQWHWDEISVLPDGAVPLLSCADGFPHQAYRLGRRVWAVQFHPEVLADDARRWAASDTMTGFDTEAIVAGIAQADAELKTVWGSFVERWHALAR